MRLSTNLFYMEQLLVVIRNQVDKFAKFNVHGDAIVYTTRANPKAPKQIGVQEGKRIFEDLYGPIAQRWTCGAKHRRISKVCREQYRLATQ